MNKKHGPWTIKNSVLKYSHDPLQVYEDQVIRPDGEPGTYAVVKMKQGVSVLALDEEGHVYLAREFRYAVGRETMETVGGAMDEGERPIDAARRELKEELGIEAEDWTELGQVDPATSLLDSPSYLFLARTLRFTEPEQEGSETIKRVKVEFDKAINMALNGEITHGSSCVLILRAQHFLREHKRNSASGNPTVRKGA